jgi:heme-degrading monooxygenase HmoA
VAIFVYLRFRLAETADIQDFEGDMRAMAELAETQPGYVWSEMGRSMQDQPVYVVVSEWDDIDDVRAWEHNAVHVEVQHTWEPHLLEPLVHRRFTPWERPTQT